MKTTGMILLHLVAGCLLNVKSGSAADKSTVVGYVSVGGAKQIAIYEMNVSTGALTARGHVDAGGAPGSLAIGPRRRFLYAAIRSTGAVATFGIDPKTGSLKKVATTNVVANPVYITVDQTGRYLLTTYYGAAKVAIYAIGADGIVVGKPTFVGRTGKNPHSIVISRPHRSLKSGRTNRFVYVPNTGADQILQYRFDAKTGTLTALQPAAVKTAKRSGPRHFFCHPKMPFAYCCNEKGSSVTGFSLDPETGRLKAFQTLTTLPKGFAGGNSNADIEITPDGRFLYASNRGHDSLAMYAIDQETGRLTALGQVPTEETPREFNIDPTGRFVFSAGQRSGKMRGYRIQSSGRLQPLKAYTVGRGPAWVLFLKLPGK